MNLSFGYLKDCIAFISFIIFTIIIYLVNDINPLKNIILILLILATCIDGTFTFIPNLHNKILFT